MSEYMCQQGDPELCFRTGALLRGPEVETPEVTDLLAVMSVVDAEPPREETVAEQLTREGIEREHFASDDPTGNPYDKVVAYHHEELTLWVGSDLFQQHLCLTCPLRQSNEPK